MFDLSTLNPPQQEAVLHDKGPLLILAGAGSGKTRALTHRIAYLIKERGVSPYSILAITFTNKAANEMKERVAKLLDDSPNGVWVSTFHSACVRILRRYCEHIGYGSNFSIYDTDDVKSLMKQVLKSLNVDTKRIKEKAFINEISAAKNECIGPEEYAMHAFSYPETVFAQVYAEYQRRLKENNAFDFDDLLFKTVELFDTCREALEHYQQKFEYIMVDEYQDTNTAQFRFIKQLANHTNFYGECEHNLCVVGDDDQSIYKFRGADVTNILNFENTYPHARVIKLEQNYRSTGNILNVANEVISHNASRKDKRLWTSLGDGEPVAFIQYNNDFEEARGITDEIKEAVDSGKNAYRDFAILYRTNAQSRLFEERMIYRNMPYRIVGGINFYQRKEIKDILAYLKTIDNGLDALQTKRILNIPKRGIGDVTVENIQSYADMEEISFYDALLHVERIPSVSRSKSKITGFTDMIEALKAKASSMKVSELIEEIISAIDYYDYLADFDLDSADDRKENIYSLIDRAASYEDENGDEATLSNFLAELALVADIDSVNADEDCVVLMTLHGAKGLEFENVYMSGMEDRLFPSALSLDSEAELEEERRLCYVGITRAKKKLTFSAAKQRMIHGETNSTVVSRFIIKEIPRHMLSVKGHAHESYMRAPKYDEAARPFNSTVTRDFYLGRSNPASAPSLLHLDYSVGDRVLHRNFGEGVITDIKKGTKDYEVTVDFSGTKKRMLASFAKLKKI